MEFLLVPISQFCISLFSVNGDGERQNSQYRSRLFLNNFLLNIKKYSQISRVLIMAFYFISNIFFQILDAL
jgi:hypothetical protein